MVDRTVAEEAGAAPDRMRQHGVAAHRRGQTLVGGTEDGGHRNPQRRRQMHRPGVPGNQRPARGQETDQFREVGPPDQVQDAGARPELGREGGFYRMAGIAVVHAAEQHDPRAALPNQPGRDAGVARRRPSLGVAVGGPRRDAHHRPPGVAGGASEQRSSACAHGRGRRETGLDRDRLDAQAADQLQVAGHLMDRAATAARTRHRPGQQGAPPLPGEPPALRNAGPAGGPGGTERIGEQHAGVERPAPQRLHLGPTRPRPAVSHPDHLVDPRHRREQGNQRPRARRREDRPRVVRAESREHRQRHHHVAQPVRCAYKQPHGCPDPRTACRRRPAGGAGLTYHTNTLLYM